jgi:hypothetical protein
MRARSVVVVLAVLATVLGIGQFAPTRADATAPAPTAPTPVVQGNRLVDSRNDTTFVPHGANWPSFEYACSEGWGYSQDDDTAAAATAMASWGINTVRVPLNEDCWLGSDSSDYGTSAGYKAAVAAWVNILNAHGIVAILDLHWSAPPGQRATGQWPMADSQSPVFWSSVASAYAANKSVIFDLFNEPYSIWDDATESYSWTLTWNCWENGGCAVPYVDAGQEQVTGSGSGTYTAVGMAAMVTAVRNAGASQPIMLGGLNYSNDLSGWLAHKPSDSQLIASWHNYPGQDSCGYTPACWNAATSAVAASVPIVTGEFGETDGGSSDLAAYMNWADAHGIGYLPWAWWDASGLTGDAALYALYTGPNFTPQAPEGTAYKAHLAALASSPSPLAFVTLPTPMTVPGFVPSSAAAAGSATSASTSASLPTVAAISDAQLDDLQLGSQRELRVSSR